LLLKQILIFETRDSQNKNMFYYTVVK